MDLPVPPSPIISPLDLSEDYISFREAKSPGDTTLDFDGALRPPLLLHEDLKEGCGGQLWPAGMLLTKFLLDRKNELRGKSIVELGAGGGLVGLALALAFQQDGDTRDREDVPVLITDLPEMLPLQEQNIALNSLSDKFIKAKCLPWGAALPADLEPIYQKPDVVIAADCVYFEPAFPLLMSTLHLMLNGGEPRDGKDPPVCWFCMKKRRKADMRFVGQLKKRFAVEEQQVELEGEKNVHL